MSCSKPFTPLPQNVIPVLYKLKFQPNLDEFTFTGSESVNVEVKEATNEIVVNSKNLKIDQVSFVDSNNATIPASEVQLIEDEEKAVFKFPLALSVGKGVLNTSFTGILNDLNNGFYRCKYTTPTKEVRYGASTQFETTDARQAFPCWDEPVLKAQFEVTIVGPKDRVILSNTNVKSEEPHPTNSNLKVVSFETTPIMSTYLLAFVIGEFDFLEGTTSTGVKIRIFTPVGGKEKGAFALNMALKSLPYLEEFFGITYPLPKLDHIAIADFAAGAMENWGLITYREASILSDDENTSTSRREYIAEVIAHETSHQWFGNLVTMKWWTHLWLNEGFASFMEYIVTDHIYPEFNIMNRFLVKMQMGALQLDGRHNSHPIEIPVGHPCEVDAIFDQISYEKGASVIRMLHRYIGDEAFRKGMTIYLKRHAYKNAVTEDLWKALSESSNKNIEQMMSTWTKQKGFPVITVSIKTEPNRKVLHLSQEKYCADGKLPDSEANMLWMVPISVSTAKSPDKEVTSLLMTSKTTEVVIENINPSDWVKLNPGCYGYYRVNNPPELLELLQEAIRNKTLPVNDRLGVVDDLFAMVEAGHASTVDFLKLLSYFENEDEFQNWSAICTCLGKLNRLLSHTDYHDDFHAYGRKLLSKIFATLGFDSKPEDSHTTKMLRMTILSRMLSFHDPKILEESKCRFKSYCDCKFNIEPDLRSVVYRGVLYSCDGDTFEKFFHLYREADLHEEKNRIQSALGAVRDPLKIDRVLKFSISDEVRTQDTTFVVCSVASTKEGREAAWNFFKQNADLFRTRYKSGYSSQSLIQSVSENFASLEKAKEVEEFFERNPFPGCEPCIRRSLETIKNNAAWLERDGPAIKAFLNPNVL